jgi:hypothetical protein
MVFVGSPTNINSLERGPWANPLAGMCVCERVRESERERER